MISTIFRLKVHAGFDRRKAIPWQFNIYFRVIIDLFVARAVPGIIVLEGKITLSQLNTHGWNWPIATSLYYGLSI